MKLTDSKVEESEGTGPPQQIAERIQAMVSHSGHRPPLKRPRQYLLWARERLRQLEDLYALARASGSNPEMLAKLAKATGMAKGQANAAEKRVRNVGLTDADK